MSTNEITFDSLPKAVEHLVNEVGQIKSMVENIKIPKEEKTKKPIGIEEASIIIGKAKSTIYALVRQRLLPCYKSGKKLYFYEDELLQYINSGKKKTLNEITIEAENFIKNKRI